MRKVYSRIGQGQAQPLRQKSLCLPIAVFQKYFVSLRAKEEVCDNAYIFRLNDRRHRE